MIETPTNGMPAALQAEKAVLHAFMRSPHNYIGRAAAEGVDADCFYLRRPLYEQITKWFKAHPEIENFELVTFVTDLHQSGELDACGGPSEVSDVHGYLYERFDDWEIWCDQLREAKARRIAVKAAQSLSTAFDSDEAIQTAKTALDELQAALKGKGKSKTGKQAAAEFIAQWKSEWEQTESIPGMATGFSEIDAISGGMRKGELWIVCAKSTRGKSVMMLQIAAQAITRGETVAIFSLEMMASVVTGRLVSVIGNVDFGAITQPKTSNKHERAAIGRGTEEIIKSRVFIDDSVGLTMDAIGAECQRIKDTTGKLDLIVIDYMQIVVGQRNRGETREQEVARISMAGKQMAKRFQCPVLSASQLNGAGEVRESKSLEQDADTLLFIADDGVKIGKMRNGKRDSILRLFLHGDKQKFLEYQP